MGVYVLVLVLLVLTTTLVILKPQASVVCVNLSHSSSCGRQKGPSMMTRYARSYSLLNGPSLEDSLE